MDFRLAKAEEPHRAYRGRRCLTPGVNGNATLPRLSLPEELRYEEIRVTPRPRLTVVAPERKK